MSEYVIVYGGPATGKTLNAAALMEHYRCNAVMEWGSLADYHNALQYDRVLILANEVPLMPMKTARQKIVAGGLAVPVEIAAVELGEKWVKPIKGYQKSKSLFTSPAFPPCLQRLIVVDLETSSLSPAEGGILQIGAVPLDPARADEFFTRDVRHEWWMPWEAGAAKVHGLDRATAADHRRHSDTVALEELLDWIDDTALGDLSGRMILAGMSPRFDYAFLRETAVRGDMEARFDGLVSHRTVDMHTLACAFFAQLLGDEEMSPDEKGLDGLATDNIYALLNLPPEAKPHTALEGARREADAIRRLFHLLSTPNPVES